MKINNKENIYERAVAVWGLMSQLNMLIEECLELIQAHLLYAACPDCKQKDELFVNMIEELADVSILSEQINGLVNIVDSEPAIKMINKLDTETIAAIPYAVSGFAIAARKYARLLDSMNDVDEDYLKRITDLSKAKRVVDLLTLKIIDTNQSALRIFRETKEKKLYRLIGRIQRAEAAAMVNEPVIKLNGVRYEPTLETLKTDYNRVGEAVKAQFIKFIQTKH